MISVILFLYIGVHISAPGWYYALIGVVFLFKAIGFGINWGKKVREYTND